MSGRRVRGRGRATALALALTVVLVLGLGLGLAGAGCFFVPFDTRDPADLLADGWTRYAAGRFDEALALFVAAERTADGDPMLVGRALNGEGWCHLRLGALDDAVAALGGAVARAADGADPLAGRAGARLAAGDARGARDDARVARALEPAYASFHDALDARALDAVALLASLRLGDLGAAQAELDRVAPANGLDPADPSSWVVGGAPFAYYPPALLAAAEAALAP
ncbi:MAG TPA: hypothetical protein VG389_06900 [Myxococcota bacterium]|jgi:tetratricopeptide (TPR) repeat protein|nr:hypothetical protein [Myxococcota bacterium]